MCYPDKRDNRGGKPLAAVTGPYDGIILQIGSDQTARLFFRLIVHNFCGILRRPKRGGSKSNLLILRARWPTPRRATLFATQKEEGKKSG